MHLFKQPAGRYWTHEIPVWTVPQVGQKPGQYNIFQADINLCAVVSVQLYLDTYRDGTKYNKNTRLLVSRNF